MALIAPIRVLVCGGRRYHDKARIYRVLDNLDAKYRIEAIIQGAADGADRWGAQWGWDRGRRVCSYAADWHTHGKKAGFIRNSEMLRDGKPDCVVAFPGGPGTANMVELTRRAGVPLWVIET